MILRGFFGSCDIQDPFISNKALLSKSCQTHRQTSLQKKPTVWLRKRRWGRPQHSATSTARRAVDGLMLLAWLPSAHSDPTLVMDAASHVTAPKPPQLVCR